MLLSCSQQLVAQDFKLIKMTKLESCYVLRSSNYSGSTLYLSTNGKFSLIDHTDVSSWTTSGIWSVIGDTLSLKSEIQKTLPVKVLYLDQAPDEKIKKFAIIRDLKGREYTHSTIQINSDSISCFYGDMECFGTYTNIDSIKVIVNNIASDWIKIDSQKGIIQIIVQTEINLNDYFPVNMRFKKEKDKLRLIKE